MGSVGRPNGVWHPWEVEPGRTTIFVMTHQDPQGSPAAELVEAANAFHRAAETPGIHMVVPEYLASLQEALGVVSAAWYQVAADAVPGIGDRGRVRSAGLSLEQEVTLVGSLHDVAAAFALCARACRDTRSTVTPVLARKAQSSREGSEGGTSRYFSHEHSGFNGTASS